MTDEIFETLRLYLAGEINVDSLEDKIIPFAWETEFEDQELLDAILFELIYIKDGLTDESAFRTRMAEIANQIPTAMAD